MSDRTFGETQNCRGCRYWSEMVARCQGGGPVESLCLSRESPLHGKYTVGSTSCAAWKSGHFGAIDEPGDPPPYKD